MERKTAEEILKDVFECDDLQRNFFELSDRPFSFPAIIKAMQIFADQEKEAEAVAVLDWYRDNKVKIHILNGMQPTSSSDIYEQFKQQTGGK